MNAAPEIVPVVLAAGGSRRLGRPKQLVSFRGRALVAHVASICAHLGEPLVVLGADAAAVRAACDVPARFVENPSWADGMASSIACAVHATAEHHALLFVACDQPLLDEAHLRALVAAYEGAVVASRYAGTLGIPALFPPSARAALAALQGDRGAKALLASARAIDWPGGAHDLDTPQDLASLGALP